MEVIQAKPMMLLPPAPGKCHLCAVDHPDWQAHNWQSLYYATRFLMAHGRNARWSDAVAHCEFHVRQQWIVALRASGHWTAADDQALADGTAIAEPTLFAS